MNAKMECLVFNWRILDSENLPVDYIKNKKICLIGKAYNFFNLIFEVRFGLRDEKKVLKG